MWTVCVCGTTGQGREEGKGRRENSESTNRVRRVRLKCLRRGKLTRKEKETGGCAASLEETILGWLEERGVK